MIRDRGGIQQTDMMALKMRTRESMEAPPRPASSWTPTPIFGGEVGCPAAACRLQEKKVTSSSPKIMGGRFKAVKDGLRGSVEWWDLRVPLLNGLLRKNRSKNDQIFLHV